MIAKILKNKIILSSVLALAFLVPATSNAQYNQYEYQYLSTSDKINYLYKQVAELQYLLEQITGNNRYQVSNPYQNYYSSYDYIIVRPGNDSGDIDVETLSAKNIESDEADLRGEVDLDNERSVTVWFEYGNSSSNLNNRTSKKTLYDSRGDRQSFTINIDDLGDDRKYYFRAVVEDEDDDRSYGEVRSFSTEDNNYYCSGCTSNNNYDFSLYVSDTSIDRRDDVEIDWEIPRGKEAPRNWIGLFEIGESNRDYVEWRYIDNDNEGTEEFTIDRSGDYEFRLFLDDSYYDEIVSRRITVR